MSATDELSVDEFPPWLLGGRGGVSITAATVGAEVAKLHDAARRSAAREPASVSEAKPVTPPFDGLPERCGDWAGDWAGDRAGDRAGERECVDATGAVTDTGTGTGGQEPVA